MSSGGSIQKQSQVNISSASVGKATARELQHTPPAAAAPTPYQLCWQLPITHAAVAAVAAAAVGVQDEVEAQGHAG